jgi:peptidyl-prolyl cis-trans isomerase D
MEKTITLPEQDIKTYYDQNLQRLAGQEQRRASHILINAAKDAPASDREKAKLKAETLLADLRKDPRNFADVARKNSQDTASASKGGDLDFFAKGAMVKAFEDAAFSLKKGDISSVVESDFGYHIILLTDIKAAAAPSFEAMRPQLEADLRKQQAKRQFAEYAETFSNSVYEQADTFKPVAEKLKLTVQSAKGLTRSPSPASEGFLANPKLLEAVFAEDSVSKRRNTAAMEVGNNTLVSARIINHRPAVLRPFAEVKDAVRVQYIQQEALKLAKSEGQAKLLEWKNKPELAQLGAPLLVSRDQTQGQPQALIDAALRADPVNVPSFLGVDLGLQGFALVRLNKLVPRDPLNAQQQDQSRQQFARLLANAEANAYLVYLRTQFKAEILVPQPKTSTGS